MQYNAFALYVEGSDQNEDSYYWLVGLLCSARYRTAGFSGVKPIIGQKPFSEIYEAILLKPYRYLDSSGYQTDQSIAHREWLSLKPKMLQNFYGTAICLEAKAYQSVGVNSKESSIVLNLYKYSITCFECVSRF